MKFFFWLSSCKSSYVMEVWYFSFLGAFAKFRKAAISFVTSVCPSVRPCGTIRLLLDGLSWNFIFEYFWKICWKFSRRYGITAVVCVILQNSADFVFIAVEAWKHARITGTFHEDLCTFVIKSRWSLLRMRIIPDKFVDKNQNTHFMFNNFFPKIVLFMR
jgi:hypothetical protein